MKTRISLIKKLRKGMTLLELVIAMSISAIVFSGAGVALFAINKASQKERKNHICLYEARTLAHAIDSIFKNANGQEIVVVEDSDAPLGKTQCDRLFTVGSVQYGFNKNVFGIIDHDTIEGSNKKYSTTYDMYFSVQRQVSLKFVEFSIHYGTNYESRLSLVERI